MPTTPDFEKAYKSLNTAQKRAVDAIEGPVMVIAGPGTGKTQIIALRIANILLKTDVPPSGVLAITFTDAGVKAMRLRLREFIGGRADEIRLHTFHGFAASIISEHPEHFIHLSRSSQMTEIEAEDLIRSILQDEAFAPLRPLGDPDYYIGKIIKTISEAKKEAWTPEIVRTFASEEIERLTQDEASRSTRGATKGDLKADVKKRIEKCEKTKLFADVYKAYEAKKQIERKIDFDDLIIEVLLAMKRDEMLLRMVQEQFLYILVDEHQDTNDSQNLLIKMIADFFETPNLFVVGDEKQAIYRFQGASVQNFLSFRKSWPTMEIIPLESNYRSHQGILDAGFSLIENNYSLGEHTDLRTKLISAGNNKPHPLTVITAGNTEAAEHYLVEESKKILEEHAAETIAIIVRTNLDAERIRTAFETRGMSIAGERGADVFSHPIARLFFDLISFLSDPSSTPSLASTVVAGLWNIPFSNVAPYITALRSGNHEEVYKKIPAIERLLKERATLDPVSFLISAGNISGITKRATEHPLSMQVWRSLIELAQSLVHRKPTTDPTALMKELLAYKLSAESKSIKVPTGAPESSIRVMTAHGAKGLEFDHVFIPYSTEESWMTKTRSDAFILPREKGDDGALQDSRRLFYVAITRARKNVTIISDVMKAGGENLTPLRFINELDAKTLSHVDIPARNEQAFSAIQAPENQARNELAQFAIHILLEKGLSVTALNHFLKCPNEYFYESILKVPEPIAASAEKGTAMHEAMANVWALSKKIEPQIAETINNSVATYMGRSLLPSFEKKQILEHIKETAPLVSKALMPHFISPGNISTERWFETRYETENEGAPVEIKLHGKLDAVLENGQSVNVFDYKTKQAMSINEIKGKTKNATGDFFRQLVFYKFLLQSHSQFKNMNIEPSLVFVEPDEKGRCPIITLPIEQSDIDQLKKEISSLISSVLSGKLLSGVCDDKKCEYCARRAFLAS